MIGFNRVNQKKFITGFMLVIPFLLFAHVGIAHADVNPDNPLPALTGFIPDVYLNNGDNDIPSCDAKVWSDMGAFNFFGTWASGPESATSFPSATVNQGSSVAIPLHYNMVGVNCHDSSITGGIWIDEVSNNIKSTDVAEPGGVDAGVGILKAGDLLTIPIGNGNVKGARNVGAWAFELTAPAGGWQVSGDYIVRFRFTTTYHRSNGTYACAEGTAAAGHGAPGDGFCVEWSEDLKVPVTVVPPNQPPSGTVTAVCNGGSLTVQVGTSDPENDILSVAITLPGGATDTKSGTGTFNFGPYASAQDGVTKTVTGTVKDAANPAQALTGSGSFTCSSQVTISGSVYDAHDMAIKYSIRIYYSSSCPSGGPPGGAPYVDTDGAGNYSFTVPQGTAFCIRTYSAFPTYTDAVHVRPTRGAGFLGCAEFTSSRNPNYCPGLFYYGGQTAGAPANGTNRGVNGGYDLVYTRPEVTVQGVIYNAYDFPNTSYAGIEMRTCVAQPAVKTNGSGVFSFTLHRGDPYCLQPISGFPAGYRGYNVRPWAEGYPGGPCAGYTLAQASPNYCAAAGTYEWQIAGGAYPFGPNIDRSADNGFDFVIRFAPSATCSIADSAPVEAGVPNNYTVTMSAIDTGSSLVPPVSGGTFSYVVTGVGSVTDSKFGELQPRGSSVVIANDTYTIASPGTYQKSGSIIYSGDGYNVGPVPCQGSSSAIASFYPYLKAFGSDVWAGGSFTPSCTATSGGVYAKARANGAGSSGSSGQLGVMALLDIKGFYSSSQKTTGSVTPIKGSSFSNTAGDTTYGGAFGGSGVCMPDYYTNTQETVGIAVKGNADFPPQDTFVPGKPKQDAVTVTTFKPKFRWSYVGGTSTVIDLGRGIFNTVYSPPAWQTTDGYTNCTRFDNYLETHPVWSDNWLCSLEPISFSTEALKETNMAPYTLINEPSDPAWNNSYVGIIGGMSWSYTGNPFPANLDRCVNITEPGDPAWSNGDNYLCAPPLPITTVIKPEIPATPDQIIPGKFDAGKSRYMLTGTQNITGLNIPVGSQVAIYVDGDVKITGNITYGGPAATRDTLPYLAIIARGNIYIDPGVDRIDGLLIAQPRDLTAASPTDGRIYTCAPGGVPPTAANIYASCNTKQLVVNGSLVAQQIKFGRTFKSLKDSSSLEAPAYLTGTGTNAAELINYSPEMYLAPSPLRDPNQTTGQSGIYGKYEAASSLPPVY